MSSNHKKNTTTELGGADETKEAAKLREVSKVERVYLRHQWKLVLEAVRELPGYLGGASLSMAFEMNEGLTFNT